MDLFDAYNQDKLPKDQAYIVSSFINVNTGYAIYELVSYSGVKSIYQEGDGITFQSEGKKMHILVEPASYTHKAVEPYLRANDEQIPLRFSELNVYTTKTQIKIYMAKEPTVTLSSFTIAKPVGFNVSFLFYKVKDLYENLTKFFGQTLNKDARIPQSDSKKIAKMFVDVISEQMAFKSDYGA